MLSIEENIAALEEQLNLVEGRGSAAKKKSIIKQIDELKSQLPETLDNEEAQKLVDSGEAEIPEESILEVVGWQKVTEAQVQEAEKAGLLCGYDPDKMIALIRKA